MNNDNSNNNTPTFSMDREVHDELFELIEDSVEFFCNEHMVSGELAWLIVEINAQAKIAQFNGECI